MRAGAVCRSVPANTTSFDGDTLRILVGSGSARPVKSVAARMPRSVLSASGARGRIGWPRGECRQVAQRGRRPDDRVVARVAHQRLKARAVDGHARLDLAVAVQPEPVLPRLRVVHQTDAGRRGVRDRTPEQVLLHQLVGTHAESVRMIDAEALARVDGRRARGHPGAVDPRPAAIGAIDVDAGIRRLQPLQGTRAHRRARRIRRCRFTVAAAARVYQTSAERKQRNTNRANASNSPLMAAPVLRVVVPASSRTYCPGAMRDNDPGHTFAEFFNEPSRRVSNVAPSCTTR